MRTVSKVLGLLFSVVIGFSSCGSDGDSTDYTLYDKSEILGTQKGKFRASLTTGLYEDYTSTTETKFLKIINDANNLNLFTEELGGPILATNFRKDIANDAYNFNLSNVASVTFTGEEIPQYIKDWYDKNILSKVELTSMQLSQKAVYSKSTKAINFSYKGTIKLYSKKSDNSNENMVVATNTILIEYINLIKQ